MPFGTVICEIVGENFFSPIVEENFSNYLQNEAVNELKGNFISLEATRVSLN